MVDPSSAGDRDELLFELGEELRAARATGESIDAAAWALRLGLSKSDVEQALAALEGLGFDEWAKPSLPRPLPKPTLPDDYELIEEIGRGGMGVVWRARQTSLDREVAVKVLMPGELVFGEALERFRREAKNLARLRHRHIVRVHDVGEHGGHVYFVMDFVEGSSLAQTLAKESPMGAAQAVRILRQTTSAIAYVHERGLVHRDLKPGNILIGDDGDAYVVDFGLALDRSLETEFTATGNLLGTPAYMAPEQARGDRALIGEASDVYALGAILYECLGGSAPFAGLGIAELVHAVLHEDPKPLAQRNPQVPGPLALVTAKAMAKDPKDRYPTAKALLEDLERFDEGRSVRAEPPKLRREILRWVRRERTLVMAVIATFVLTFGLFQVGNSTSSARDPILLLARSLVIEGKSDVAASLFGQFLDQDEALEDSELVLGGVHELLRDSQSSGELAATFDRRARSSFQAPRLALLASAAASLQGQAEISQVHLDRAQSHADSLGDLRFFDLIRQPLLDMNHADHEAWIGFAWEVLERPRLTVHFLDWLAREGQAGAALLLELLRSSAARGVDLQAALAPSHTRAQQAWVEYLYKQGASLLPRLVQLAKNPDAPGRDAALHLANAITGLSASPWNGVLRVDSTRLLREIEAWPGRSPIQRDFARLRLALDAASDSPELAAPWFQRHFGTHSLFGGAPTSAEDLSERMKTALGLTDQVDQIDPADLLERFHASSRYERRRLHRMLAHLLGDPVPPWPLDIGTALREPIGLADRWHSRVHPNTDAERWNVRWAWIELSTEPGSETLLESGRLAVQRSEPFELSAQRSAPIKRYETRHMTGPSYLGYGPRGPNPVEWVRLSMEGRAGFAPKGMRLNWGHGLADRYQPRWNIRARAGRWGGYAIGEVHVVATAKRWGEQSLERPEQLQALVAVLEDAGSEQPWSVEDWAGALEGGLPLLPGPEENEAEPDSEENLQSVIVLGSLAAFALLSVLMGLAGGLRALLRRGVSWSKILRVTCLSTLIAMVFTSLILTDAVSLLATSPWMTVLILWGCTISAFFALSRKRSGLTLRAPSLIFGIAAALATWHAITGARLEALAWATLLAPAAVLACLMVLEIELRLRGFRRGISAILAWTFVLGILSVPLLSGLALCLQTVPLSLAQSSGAALAEAMRTAPFLVWLQGTRSGPYASIWFHLMFWSFNPIWGRAQPGGIGLPQKVAKIRFRSKP